MTNRTPHCQKCLLLFKKTQKWSDEYGYVHTILEDSFYVAPPRVKISRLRPVSVYQHLSHMLVSTLDWIGAAQLRSVIEMAPLHLFLCEQNWALDPLWFLWRRKSYVVYCEHSLKQYRNEAKRWSYNYNNSIHEEKATCHILLTRSKTRVILKQTEHYLCDSVTLTAYFCCDGVHIWPSKQS